jgi:peptidoglycan/LPS O-acetylase OafA/YrhL
MPSIPALDGVRALAVIAVLLYHADVLWMPGGFLGVEVFFVLSGFLITSLLWSERQSTGGIGLRGFWFRRARRLFPALLAMLAVVVATFLIGYPHEVARIRGDIAAALTYSSNWYGVFAKRSYFETFGRPSPFGHLWSLAIEEQFYVIWPLVVGFLLVRARNARRAAGWVLGAALASTAATWFLYSARDPSRVYFGTDTRAAGILIGAALAIVWRPWEREWHTHKRPHLLQVVALVGAFVIGWAFVRWDEFAAFTFRPGIQVVAIASALLIAALVHPRSWLAPVLGWQPLRAIGRRSYGIYLWHWPIFVLTRPGLDIHLTSGPVLAIRLALTFAVAEASFRYIEEPIRNGALGRLRHELFARHRRTPRIQRRRVGWAGVSLVLVLDLVLMVGGVVHASAPVRVFSATTEAEQFPLPREQIDGARLVSVGRSQPLAPPIILPPIPDVPLVLAHVDAIGDSVMVDAKTALRRRIKKVYIDAKVGRQVYDGIAVLRALRAANKLADVVVIHLGTNGMFTSTQFDTIMKILSGVREVVFVNVKVPRRWETPVNRTIAAGVNRYRHAVLVDWHDRWRACGGTVFGSDGVHLTANGASCYAALVAAAISS